MDRIKTNNISTNFIKLNIKELEKYYKEIWLNVNYIISITRAYENKGSNVTYQDINQNNCYITITVEEYPNDIIKKIQNL